MGNEDPLGRRMQMLHTLNPRAGVAELADAPDSKSGSLKECRFEPDRRQVFYNDEGLKRRACCCASLMKELNASI